MPADLERLYDDYAPALFGLLLNLTRNEADTRDLLQEVFLKLARRPELLVDVHEPRAFLLRLAHNLAIDLIRSRGAREKHTEQWSGEKVQIFAPSTEPDTAAVRQALAAALSEIGYDQRAVLHLKLWEGLTFDQIAQLLEIPLNTAASRYRYGLDKLCQRLRPLYDEIK